MKNRLPACNPAIAATLLMVSILLFPRTSMAQCPNMSSEVTCGPADYVSFTLDFGPESVPPCTIPHPASIFYTDSNNPTPMALINTIEDNCAFMYYEGAIECDEGFITEDTIVLTVGTSTCTYVNGVLPVELSYFRALPGEGNKALLLWETAVEENSDVFQVERSVDGIEFRVVSEVKAAGNAHGATAYRFVDESPNAGGNYYRLKMKDLDGSHTYSSVEFLEMGAGSATVLALFPSPAKDYVAIDLREGFREGETALLEVFSIAGQRLLEKQVSVTGQLENLDIRGLNEGYYLVSLRTAGKSGNARLVIQR